MDFRCLEPWKVYGEGVKHMDVHLDKAPVDFNRWFKAGFSYRDKCFGRPDYPRWQENGAVTRYNFGMTEFAEAFFGTFSPNEVAALLDKFMVDTTDESEAFIQRVRGYEKEHKVAGIERHTSFNSDLGGRFHPDYNFMFVVPFNFKAEELNCVVSDCNSFWYKKDSALNLNLRESDYPRTDLKKARLRKVLPIRGTREGFLTRYRLARRSLENHGFILYTPLNRDFWSVMPKSVEGIAAAFGIDVHPKYFRETYERRKTNPDAFKVLLEALEKKFIIGHLLH